MNNTLKWILIAVAILASIGFGGYKLIMNSGILDAVNPEAIQKVQDDVQAIKDSNADYKTCLGSYKGNVDDIKGIMQFAMWGTSCAQIIPPSQEFCATTSADGWADSLCSEINTSNLDNCRQSLVKLVPEACNPQL